MPFPKSWVTRLPVGLREQPGWVFIGTMIALVGISYMLGVSTSTVTQAIGTEGLRGWGAFLAVTGSLLVYATWSAKLALEKMALRWLVFAMMSYCAWLTTVVPVKQLAFTLTLSTILIVLAEIRVGYLKLLFDIAKHKGGEHHHA